MITYTTAQAIEWCHRNEIFIHHERLNDYFRRMYIEHKGIKKYGTQAYSIDHLEDIIAVKHQLYCRIYEKHLIKQQEKEQKESRLKE